MPAQVPQQRVAVSGFSIGLSHTSISTSPNERKNWNDQEPVPCFT